MLQFKGKITFIDDQEITIKFADNQSFTIPIDPELKDYNIGDSITLALDKNFASKNSTTATDILNAIIKPSK